MIDDAPPSTLDDLSHFCECFPDSARIYIRPTCFVDRPCALPQVLPHVSPHVSDVQCLRLAGSLLWFSAWEITWRDSSPDSSPDSHSGGALGRGLERALGQRVWTRKKISRKKTSPVVSSLRSAILSVSALDNWIAALPEAFAERLRTYRANATDSRPTLTMGARRIALDQPQIMGILNHTPDSFSDGGHYADSAAAIAAGFAMANAGAAILDVGGESTRPDAKLVWEEDEIARIEPIITALAQGGVALSVDTRKASVMQAALAAGATMVNDVSALRYDERALEVVAAAECAVVLMHAPSASSDPHADGHYTHPLFDVFDMLESRIALCLAANIDRARIFIDPGIGFGKSVSDNLALTNGLALFHTLGCPIVYGASRKRLISALDSAGASDARLGGSVALHYQAAMQGVQLVRVHDVPETRQALRIWRGLRDAALAR